MRGLRNITWHDRLDTLVEIIQPHVVPLVGRPGRKAIGASKTIAYALSEWVRRLDEPVDSLRFDTYVRGYLEMAAAPRQGKRRMKNIYFTDAMDRDIDAINEIVAPLVPMLDGNRTAIVMLAVQKCADALQ
jgi:hypothetical protein